MVKYISESLDATFSALSDPIRRKLLEQLTEGPATVNELADPFDISLPAISRHLKVLAAAGLVLQQRDGRLRHCHLVAGPIRNADEWIRNYRQFWDSQFSALDRYLESSKPTEELSE